MRVAAISLACCAAVLGGCSGGSGAAGGGGLVSTPAAPVTQDCSGSCASPTSFLTVSQVQGVIARAVAEAQARNQRATIAVVDRVGNVLAVFVMNGAPSTVTIRSTSGSARIDGGLENVEVVPATMVAIAKAVTGAYLSSEGNAFSTRTASQIVQAHFNPGESLSPGGPLFGVQFSQLPCSDLSSRFGTAAGDTGPKRSPLGLSADPGGLPLYLDGTPVGGVGIVADGLYGLDANIFDKDIDLDEAIAVAASYGLGAPLDRRADRITADGKTLRFTDLETSDLVSNPVSPPAYASLEGGVGKLVAVTGYAAAQIRAGVAFGSSASGIRADSKDFAGLDAFVLVDAANVERYRPRAGSEAAGALTESEVRAILSSAMRTANRARAQIRRPLGTPARVTASVVDSAGNILGIVRTRDAPVFGVDVSLQKARTAEFFSNPVAATAVAAMPNVVHLDRTLKVLRSEPLSQFVTASRSLLGVPTAFGDGQYAFSARAIGNLARPNYPDGVDGNSNGSLARKAGQWSPFNTGFQLDLIHNALIQHIAYVVGLAPEVPQNCTAISGFDSGFTRSTPLSYVANGIQIFPGGVPIYRNDKLVGAIGVSGDGVDQDDMIAFLGPADAGLSTSGVGNAPSAKRADQLVPAGSRLRYVSCPQAPFIDSGEQEPCNGR